MIKDNMIQESTTQECTIIGFGKVGKTLSLLMKRNRNLCLLHTIAYHKTLPTIVSEKTITCSSADEFIAENVPAIVKIDELRTIRGITALTVSDDAIDQVSEKLSTQCAVVPGAIVFHCSGVHTSDALSALRAKGAYTASIHPAFSFGDPSTSANSFPGTVCSYEGDEEALAVLLPIFERFGGAPIPIDPLLKAAYHAGCCVASNYLVGLYALSENILASAGVPRKAIPAVLIPLMQSALNNLSQKTPSEALSGPIARNDLYTVELHTQSLSEEYASYYKNLGNLLIDQSGLCGREEIKKLLERVE
jgi:predicted short-subunit dehydrogenase-like oxidoreductase (DUF2520 family)